MERMAPIGGTALLVRIEVEPPYVVAVWSGAAPEHAEAAAREAVDRLLSATEENLVLDVGELAEVGEGVARALAALVVETQRLGRNVCLVRCADCLFRELQAAGVAGALSHAASVSAATQGLFGKGTKMLELHLRSMPELLARLRHVVTVVSRQAGFSETTEILVKAAVTEAAANAIVHGSPEGSRNHVRIAFHLDQGALTVDVADQGPGFDPRSLKAPPLGELQDHGFGLRMIRQSMDRVEFFRGDRGMLVRMTKFVGPQASWVQ